MNEAEKIELVERYLMGQMSDAEKISFSKKLEDDASLKQLFEEMKTTIGIINSIGREELIMKIKQWDNELGTYASIEKAQSRKQALPYLLGIAATVILFVMAAILFSVHKQTDNIQLFAEYFEPYPDISGSAERGSKEADIWTSAMKKYNANSYNEALQAFDMMEEDPEEHLLHFYKANAYLATQQPDMARTSLEKIKGKIPPLNDQIEWYLALTHLQENNYEHAALALESIKDSNSSYQRKARKLHKQLKR